MQIRNSFTKCGFFFALCALFEAASLFILFNAGDTKRFGIGAVGALLFGILAAIFLRRLTDQRVRIEISDQGFADHSVPTGVLAWQDIEVANLKKIFMLKIMLLRMRSDAQPHSSDLIRIDLSLLERSADEIFAMVEYRLKNCQQK